MSSWLHKLWRQCQVSVDEAATRTRRVLALSENSSQLKHSLKVCDLEPRVLFSATPVDLASLPGGNEAIVAEAEMVPSDVDTEATAVATQTAQAATEIIIVDANIDSLQQLLDDLASSRPDADIFVLDSARDGIDQITELLAGRTGIDSLHIVSHGASGSAVLGNLTLNDRNLDGYAGQIAAWQASFSATADILVYGCELASNSAGRSLLESLSALTGADVAASIDDTGHTSLGGDWDLEFNIGLIDTDVAFSATIQGDWLGLLNAIPAGPEIQINAIDAATETTGIETAKAVASNAAGDFVVVWQSTNNGLDVYARRFNKDGVPIDAADIAVNNPAAPFGNEDQFQPTVDMNDNGDFVVVWTSLDEDGDKAGVYGKLYRGGLEHSFQAHVVTIKDQLQPAVGIRDDGSFVVSWTSDQQDGNRYGVYLRRFDNTAMSLDTSDVRVNLVGDKDQQWSAVATGPGNEFVVTWTSEDQDGDKNGIFAQRFDFAATDANYLRIGSEFRVNVDTVNDQQKSAVAMHTDGTFVITWESDDDTLGQWQIFARRYAAEGTPLSGDILVSTSTTKPQTDPAVSFDAAGNFLVTWSDNSDDVRVRQFDSSGNPRSGEILANTYLNGTQWRPAVASLLDGSFVVVWSGEGDIGLGHDGDGIHAQRFAIPALPLIDPDGDNSSVAGNIWTTGLTEGGTPVAIMDVDPRLSDVDDTNVDSVVIAIVNALNGADEQLTWTDHAAVTETWNSATHTLTLTGGTLAQYETVLASVRYQNSSEAPLQDTREIRIYAKDASTLLDGPSAWAMIDINVVNDAPIITAPANEVTDEDTPLVFRTPGNPISIADDSLDHPIDVTITATNGTVTVNAQLGDEQRINVTTAGDQDQPVVAVAADGRYVVVWTQAGGGTGDDIIARTYNADGTAYSGEILVAGDANHERNPAVAIDNAGNFVVVWEDDTEDADDKFDLEARTFDFAGVAYGNAKRINKERINEQLAPSVAFNQFGDFIVAWQSQDTAGSGDGDKEGVYYRRWTLGLQAIDGDDVQVNTTTASKQLAPAVASLPNGQFVIVWQSKDQDGDKEGIYAQRFDSDGTRIGIEFQVNLETANSQSAPSVFINRTGEFVVAWQSLGQDDADGLAGIYARKFDFHSVSATPAALTAELLVNTETENSQNAPSVTIGEDGRFAVAWQSHGQDSDDGLAGIYLQQFEADGSKLQGEILVNTETDNSQSAPTISMSDASQLVAVWQSTNQDNPDGTNGIYSQRFLRPGALQFTVNDGIDDVTTSFTGSLVDVNAAMEGLRFTPDQDYHGAATVQIDVDDLGYTGSGGNQSDTHTIDINVNSVNDAPEIHVPGDQQVPESQVFAFQAIDANHIAVSDIDADGQLVEVRLDIAAGMLHVDLATGVTLVGGTFNDSNDLHFQGTLAEINDALDGLTWQAPAIFATFALNIEVDDLGNSPGPNLTTNATIDLNVFDFNIPPVNVYPSSAITPENQSITFTGGTAIQVNDADAAADDDLEVTLIATHGVVNIVNSQTGVTVTGNNTSTVIVNGEKDKLNAVLDALQYIPTANYAGPATLQIISNDLGNNGVDGAKIDRDFIPIITVAPDATNNAPTISGPNSGTITEESPLIFSSVTDTEISINDDAGGNDIRVTVSTTDGTLSLSSTSGTQFQVNIETSGDQENVSVAMNPAGTYVVAWQSDGQDGDGKGIYAQRYSAEGLPLDAEFKVNATEHKNQTEPAVAIDDNGRFVVTWTTEDQDANGKAIYAQAYAADGTRIGSEFQVNTYEAKNQESPAIAMDADGRFVIVWASDDQDADDFGIFGQVYEINSDTFDHVDPIGSEFQVNFAEAKDQIAPAVAMDDDGDFVVVWQSKGNGDDKWDIKARRFQADGTAKDLAGDLIVNSIVDEDQQVPAVAMDQDGNFVVTWQSKDLDYADGKFGIYQRRFHADGTYVTGQQDLVNTHVLDDQSSPAIAMSRAGDYVISWQSKKQDDLDGKEGIFAQRYAADGAARGNEFQVNSTTANEQIAPAISMGDDGRYVILWSSDAEDSDGFGVFGQRYKDIADLNFVSGDGIDDSVIVFEGTIDEVNDALDGLAFLPAVDFEFDRNGLAEFVIAVDDLGWSVTGSQGIPETQSHTVGVTVNPVNDAPAFTLPAAQTAYERVPLEFSAFNQNIIAVYDADVLSDPLQMTLTSWGGTLTLSDTSNLTFTNGDGANDVAMTFTGTLADINAALNGMTYTPPAGFAGSGSIQIFADDLGNNGSGGPLQNYGLIEINVQQDAVNDAPDILIPNPQRTDKDVPLVLGELNGNQIQIADDAGTEPISVTLTATNGTMTLSPGLGPESRVNTATADVQQFSDLAATPSGEFVVVWQSQDQDGDNAGVFGQRYSAGGQKVGPEFQINQYTQGAQFDPSVAISQSGEFVVSWTADGQDGNGKGIYARKYASDGSPVSDEILVNSSTINDQENSDVVIDAQGNFAVVWQGAGAGGSGDDIWLQRFDANGVAIAGETLVNAPPGNQINPKIGMDSAGNFVIVWQAPDANGLGIFAQRYDSAGVAIGGVLPVNTLEDRGDETEASISVNSPGRFVIAWQSDQNDEVRASYFDNDGSLIREDFVVKDAAVAIPTKVTVALSDNDEFVVGWQSDDFDGTGVWAQRFDSNGDPLATEFAVNTSTINHQTSPVAAIDDSGNTIFSWTSDNGGVDKQDVYAQRFFKTELLSITPGLSNQALIILDGPADLINAALNNMTFTPDNGFDGLAGIDITVDDQGNSGVGGAMTDTDTVAILVAGAPFIDLDADNSSGAGNDGFQTHFAAGSPPIKIVDSDALIDDTGAGEIKEMLITLTTRSVSESLSGLGTANITVEPYDPASGLLRLVGNASRAEYLSVLQNVVYDNPSGTPSDSERLITVTYLDKDNNWSNLATTTVLIDLYPPELTLTGQTVYTEGDPATLIVSSASVFDPDTTNFAGGTLTIDMASSGSVDDRLSIRNEGSGPGQIEITGKNIWYNFGGFGGFEKIGQYSSFVDGTTPMVISLTSFADSVSVAALMENVLFANVSGNPTTNLRAVRFVLNDGDGGISNTASVTVRVDKVNSAPTISSIGDTSIVANASTGPITFTISDVETAADSLTVSATSNNQTLIPDANLVLAGSGSNRTVEVVPASGEFGGPVTITITVDDGEDLVTETFSVTVTLNNLPPTISLSNIVSFLPEDTETSSSVRVADILITDDGNGTNNLFVSGTDAASFVIVGSELHLQAGTVLDYEGKSNYDVRVNVDDTSQGAGVDDFEDVTLLLNDVDEFDVGPIADSNASANAIDENMSPGTVVGLTASATDNDATNNLVTYALFDNDGGRFAVDPNTGVVFAALSLDRESDGPTRTIIVRATSDDTSFIDQSFVIVVNDVNEFDVNTVIDTNAAANVVDENAGVGAIVGITAAASDADATNNAISYSLLDDDGGRFAIDPASGIVTVAGAIDRESDGPVRNITVRATSADSSFTDQVFAIGINDLNEFDVGPVSDSNGGANAVNENASVGTLIGITAVASDADATGNSVTYSLADNDGGRFTIHSGTGVVSVAGAIDRETDGAARSITVRATSADASFSDQVFVVAINDVNEFSVGPLTDTDTAVNAVAENATAGTTVGITANANDMDATSSIITYSLADDDGGRFAIDSATGVVSVAGAIDRETDGPIRSITVRATSVDLTFTDRVFTIAVNDVDEFDVGPVIDTDTSANTVPENAASGSPVGITAAATDGDATNNLITYSLLDNDGGRFAIHSGSGVVTVAGAIDREADGPIRNITVRATSADLSVTDQVFAITISDADEFDVGTISDTDAANNAVDENALVGTIVGLTAFASDGDATNNAISYSLDDSAGGRFAIDGSSGVITVAGALDRETNASHGIVVRAISADGSSSTRAFSININDIPEPDALWFSTSGDVTTSGNPDLASWDEDQLLQFGGPGLNFDPNGGSTAGVLGITGFKVSNFGAPANTRIEAVHHVWSNVTVGTPGNDYQLLEGDLLLSLAQDGVTLNSNTEANKTFDRNDVFVFRPTAAGDYTTGDFFHLLDDPLSTGSIRGVTLVESPAGVLVGDTVLSQGTFLLARDGINEDDRIYAYQPITVGLANTSGPPANVLLEGASATETLNGGNLGFTGRIDGIHLVESTRTIGGTTIQAGDLLVSTFGGFSIAGTAVEDQDIALLRMSTTRIGNDHSSGTAILFFDASDEAMMPLDAFEDIDALTLVEGAISNAPISGISDSDPATNEVNEDAGAGTVVGISAVAVDPDVGQNITYSLDDDAGGRFAINSTSGIVTVIAVLDAETSLSHSITVRATSDDTSASTSDFTILVNDVDEFDVGPLSDTDGAINGVDENAAAGTFVGITALATDDDVTNNIISYSLTDDDGGHFAIDSVSGTVTVASVIDRETHGPNRNITIRATSSDGSVNDQVFAVAINDIDEFDVGPINDVQASANEVPENAVIGTTVGITASASDNDSTNNAIIYSLLDSDGGRFAIDATSGLVTVAGTIDREADGPLRNITVRATSSDGSTNDRAFTIAVNDLDEFDIANLTDTDGAANQVDENAIVGAIVGITVSATDDDATNNAISYSLLDDDGGRFAIDATSGIVTVADAIDRETDGPSRNITVRVSSVDGSLLDQVFAITINDVDEFDAMAISDADTSANEVLEASANGTVVGLTALATDDDATNNTITYTLDDNAGGRFTIDANSGVVTVADGSLLVATTPNHDVVVRATSSDLSTTTQLFTINVRAANVAPVLTKNALQVGEGQTITLTAADLGATDVDDPDAGLTISVSSIVGGRFALAASPGVDITTFTQAQIAAGQIIFVDDGDEIGPTYDITVSDGDKSDGPHAAVVTFTNVNDAPTIGDATLASINEDNINSSGVNITGLFGSSYSDPDSIDTLAGIVIVGNTADSTTQGSWQYSSDGTSWANVGAGVGNSTGLVVAADTLLRFVPVGDFNGQAGSLIVRGLDSSYAGLFSTTAGTEVREIIDTSSPTSSKPFSIATSKLETLVAPVNDQPTLSSHTITVAAGTSYTSSKGVFASLADDVDGDALTASLVSGPSHGTLVLAANGSFFYKPTAGFVGTDSFTWQSFDGTSFSSDAMVTVSVKPFVLIGPPTTDSDSNPDPTPTPQPEPLPTPNSNPDPEPDPAPEEGQSTGGSHGSTGGNSNTSTGEAIDLSLPTLEEMTEDGQSIFDVVGHRPLSLESLESLAESDSNLVTMDELRRKSRSHYETNINLMDAALMMAPGPMWTQMDATRDELESQIQGDLIVVGAAGAAASGFTVGFVAWAIRSGFLISGLLAQLPAWRSIDPLLIMQGFEVSDDEETLEELMQRESESLD